MEDSASTISSWLKRESSGTVEILTIWGMAGIGKTTLAKHIYILHRGEFEASRFVEEIGGRCAQQLLSTSKIEKGISRKKMLLVLDDVDNFDQLDVLIGKKSFHPGSKIIITTKDGSLTEKCSLFLTTSPPKHTKHPLGGLHADDLRLFFFNAFGNIYPKKSFEYEAQRAAEYCGGHPLALKLLGRSLVNANAAIWSDAPEMLESKGYLTDVKEVLQISFNSLPEKCKELFKHNNVPFSISKLKKVRILSLDGCLGASEFQMLMPKDMESYASSSSLRISKSFLISLPASLVSLSLKGNNLSNECFPKDLSSMSMLKELFLDGNPIDSLPDCVRSLSRLELLTLNNCLMLKSVLCPPHTIKCLDTEFCSSLVKITFPQEMSAPPAVDFYLSESLTEIQGIFKMQALAEIDEKILCSLGWTDLQHVKDLKVPIQDIWRLYITKKLPVQMVYEFGIFSTCFPGKVVPDWFAQKSNGSSISFTMPSCSMNKTIQGINICFVYTCSDPNTYSSYLSIEVRNVTKERTWKYFGWKFAVGEADKDLVWLSHWMFGNNEIENDDEVSVRIGEDGLVMVRECAVSPVYNDRDNEEDPLSYYKSWKRIIGGDLSAFQRSPGTFELYSPI